MKWLLWKDYRENRPVVFTAAGLVLLPHLIALCAACVQYFRWHEGPQMLMQDFIGSSIYALIISQLAIALIGGNAIAGERADRSAEFLASLPIAKQQTVTSKLLLSLAIAAVTWIPNAIALLYLSALLNVEFPRDVLPLLLGGTAIVSMTFFGVAWMLSSFLRSPTFSVVGGLLAPGLLFTAVWFVCYLFDVPERYVEPITCSYFGLCLVTAPVCFCVGTWYYLHRVEP